MTLYTIHNRKGIFNVNKFDDELNFEGTYTISRGFRKLVCTCHQGLYPTCKHRELLKTFQESKKVNTPWFYDLDKKKWTKPLKI